MLPESGVLTNGLFAVFRSSRVVVFGPVIHQLHRSVSTVPVSVHALRVGQLRWRGEELGDPDVGGDGRGRQGGRAI